MAGHSATSFLNMRVFALRNAQFRPKSRGAKRHYTTVFGPQAIGKAEVVGTHALRTLHGIGLQSSAMPTKTSRKPNRKIPAPSKVHMPAGYTPPGTKTKFLA